MSTFNLRDKNATKVVEELRENGYVVRIKGGTARTDAHRNVVESIFSTIAAHIASAPTVQLVHWVKIENLALRAVTDQYFTVDAHQMAEYVEATMNQKNSGDLQVTVRMLDERSVPTDQYVWGRGR